MEKSANQVKSMEESAKRRCICKDDGIAGSASGAHSSTEDHGTANSSGYDFEVFLSFRGPDTRATFTDHLYISLKDAGIRAFKDDEDLRKGEEFAPELLQAIKESKILVPIFSKGYATSVWCLKEVVQMVKCKKNEGQKIMPIFYDVTPAEVRHQIGGYGEAFRSHKNKKRHDEKTMQEWRDALSAVAELNGWDLQSMSNGREGEFVKTFTRKVFNELKKASLAVSDYLVGVDNHVDAIMEKIGVGTSETRVVGNHGMGGIGKTTIAKLVFNRFSPYFDNCCFLRDIRETSQKNGVQCLQKQLISSILKKECTDIKDIDEGTQTIKNRLSKKRVLLLLDDVEEGNHIHALVCNRDWLGEGSKIIITTRRKDVLCVPEVDWRYEITGMDRDRSLQLFSKHAFRRDSPLKEYINQSNKAIDIAGGLPLALEVLGSHLSGIEKKKWDLTLKKLENVPHTEVQCKLRISYDTLDLPQQHIFLDIACLFIGYEKDILVRFWDESFFPEDAMEVLQNKSLIKITEYNKVWMHDQIRHLGREMVHQESNMKLKKQSRVWNGKQGFDLLRKHKGKKEVEALRLHFDHADQYCFTYEGFESLSNLKYLEVFGLKENFRAEERLLWHDPSSNVLPTNEKLNLLPQLRWLSWRDIPQALNIAKFFMKDVVILNLSESAITHAWEGWNHMKVMKNLKVLNLSNCKNLERLPYELGRDLASLEYLDLNGSRSLKKLPNSIENLESLIGLDISYTGIEELPDFIGKLKNLKKLKMHCYVIRKIPDALWTIGKLEEIEAFNVNFIWTPLVNIGNCIYKNQSLRILKLHCVHIRALPRLPESLVTLHLNQMYMDTFPDLSNLTNLKDLNLCFHSRDSDEEFDGLVENPTSPYVTTSPTDLTIPPHLKSLRLQYCRNLRRLPRLLPSSLSSLDLRHCNSLRSMEDLSNLKNLSSLFIGDSAIEEIQGLGCLDSLQDLHLSWLGQVKILPDLSNLNKLKSLYVNECGNLVEIQGELPWFLDKLHISYCHSLQNLPNPSSLKGKQEVFIEHCIKLNVEAILGFARANPRNLQLSGFGQLQSLPDLSNSSELRRLQVCDCPNLVEIQGELPESLEELEISSCGSLQKLPHPFSLKELKKVGIQGSTKLKGEVILGSAQGNQAHLWENLRYLRICGLEQMEILPGLSNLNKLRHLQIQSCANLVEIQGELPQSLEELEISSCGSLQKLPDLSSLKELKKVDIQGCTKLKGEVILGSAQRSQAHLWENLRYLRICGLEQTEILPDLGNLNKLRHLQVQSCANLVEIEGELPECLEELEISSCRSLHKLPDLSSLNGLREVNIYDCFGLNVEAISLLCSKKSVIFLGESKWNMCTIS